MMRKFDRYKMNLRATDDHVYSYETKVAKIDHDARTVTPNRWYSATTTKHKNYVAREYGYKVVNK
mgnify:FL=1